MLLEVRSDKGNSTKAKEQENITQSLALERSLGPRHQWADYD
jgi:hypothetical protein